MKHFEHRRIESKHVIGSRPTNRKAVFPLNRIRNRQGFSV